VDSVGDGIEDSRSSGSVVTVTGELGSDGVEWPLGP
jgi:hypothetical protein